MDLKKNESVMLTITDFNDTGLGVGRADGVPVFVSGAVIGDTVLAKITKVKKHYAYARTEEILTPSSDRVEAPCPVFPRCGGCQLQTYAYPAELAFKEKKVRDALVRIGKFRESDVDSVMHPVTGMDDPYRYRNKAQFPFGSENGSVICGFYAVHSHDIVPVSDCLTGQTVNKKILDAVKESMTFAQVDAYDENTGEGYVRHVLIRKSFAKKDCMVCVVVNATQTLSRFRDVLILQLSQTDAVSSICFNFNPDNTNVILGDETECVYGKPYIEDVLCDLTFRISAQSFYQVNPQMTEKLYDTAVGFAVGRNASNGQNNRIDSYENDMSGESGELQSADLPRIIWDLYCGIGTMSLAIAKRLADVCPEKDNLPQVYGVEIVQPAVDDAKENARINDIENATFYCGKAENIRIGDSAQEEQSDEAHAEEAIITLPQPDVIVIDPPRAGCDAALLETILSVAPKRVVYVSCDPATLARDLRILADGGYALQAVHPYDMFAKTVHIETVSLLSRSE